MADKNNVHDRHPDSNEDFDTAAPKKHKTAQETRDAHFLEYGVKADGTTGNRHFDAEGNEVDDADEDGN